MVAFNPVKVPSLKLTRAAAADSAAACFLGRDALSG